jgi:DNA-binding transcriptional LysR family regulator
MNRTIGSNDGMNNVHGPLDAGAPEQLARVDLNLLVAFDALVRERSVTRAAERVGITQSAMSHALRRLRELVGDPLLVRGQSGMVLTPRALVLVVPLQSALRTVGLALREPEPFDARRATRTFRIASPDLFDVVAVPLLLARIREHAPGVALNITSVADPQLAARLETGEVDVAVVPHVEQTRNAPPALPAQGLVRTRLFRDGFVCWLRAKHPALRGRNRLTLEAYAELPHALVAPRGDGLGQVDEALAARGLSRRVVLRAPHFYAALAIVARSDLVLTAPTALAVAEPRSRVVAVLPPIPLPRHDVNLLWHERFSSDPAHLFLREQIGAVARDIQAQLRDVSQQLGKRKKQTRDQ